MSRVLVIPDSHLKIDVIRHGLEIADKKKADKIVMLGDYFDDWTCTDIDYFEMMDYIKKLVRNDHRIIALLGNHELSYMGFPCAGHRTSVEDYMKEKLMPDHRFYFCVAIDDVLYSHAGFTTKWIRGNKLITENDIRYKMTRTNGADLVEKKMSEVREMEVFVQAGPGRGGKDLPGPLWADAMELVDDAIPNVRQVVGHTPVKSIECFGKVWFTDVFSNYNNCDEYLLVNKGEPEIIHYGDLAYE